jgi:putative chitinase
MQINKQQLLQILPKAGPVAGVFVPAVNAAVARYAINTLARLAAFIAQTGHESAQFTKLVENLKYSAQALQATWPFRFDSGLAAEYARQPERIANVVYGSRLGNTAPGNGWRYRGRGLIQLTGKGNYQRCGNALGLPLLDEPDLLLEAGPAAMAASWYWDTNKLNALADAGNNADIGSIINTGQRGRTTNGAEDRRALYLRALKVLA